MEKLRIGIIGCGGVTASKHLPAIQKTGMAEVAALCDTDAARAKALAQQYGTDTTGIYTDYAELLKAPLDAVYVCTSNRLHCQVTVAALQAGKHVMCEKPMALNYAETEKMCRAARESGKLLTVAYQNRFRPDSLYLKQECEAGVLGEIYYARAKALRRRAVPTWGLFLNEGEQGGGPLIDIGTHALDLTLWMMNNYKPKSVSGSVFHKLNGETQPANAFGPWDPATFTVEDSAFAFIKMENGATISLEASWALNTLDVGEAKTTLCGTKAGADMNDGLVLNGTRHDRLYTLRPSLEPGEIPFFSGAEDPPEVLEQKTFFRAIRGEGELVVLPEQAATVSRILDAVYQSAREGREIVF